MDSGTNWLPTDAYLSGVVEGFKIVDGYFENGTLIRSVNHVFVGGVPQLEKLLESGDVVTIGESTLAFKLLASHAAESEANRSSNVNCSLSRSSPRTYCTASQFSESRFGVISV